jgi:hypothetical protein
MVKRASGLDRHGIGPSQARMARHARQTPATPGKRGLDSLAMVRAIGTAGATDGAWAGSAGAGLHRRLARCLPEAVLVSEISENRLLLAAAPMMADHEARRDTATC